MRCGKSSQGSLERAEHHRSASWAGRAESALESGAGIGPLGQPLSPTPLQSAVDLESPWRYLGIRS
jgi:hypothetical protein